MMALDKGLRVLSLNSHVRKNPLVTRRNDKMIKNNYHVTNII